MSWIRCAGLGLIAALYVLAGRWGFHRLASANPEPDPFLELRLWIVMGGLVLAAVGLVHRAHRAARPGETRLDTQLSMALLVFFGYLCASALWAPDASLALGKLYELVLAGVMSVGFGLAALRQPAARVLDAFWAVVVTATALMALAGVRQLLSGSGGARLAVLGGGPNVFARLMGLLALGALYFWYRRGRAWLWIPLAATGVILALLTGSRGGAVAIVAGVITFLVVGRVPLRRLALLSLLATAAVGVATTLSPLGKALDRSLEERFLRLTLKYEGSSDSESKVYLSGRESLYASAYELGLDNPVTGAGLAAFPALGLGVYPHNLFLEVFCEGGALGLAFLGWALLAFLRSMLRGRRGLDGATVGAVVLVLLGSQSSGDLYDSRALFLLMVMSSCTSVAEAASASPSPSAAACPTVHGAT
ncbi:O-antigen ligase family protein [Archangium sp.]|uniref:O-antigen ligase family protein n=1 Tax=Archangium sp. TaxID=1872627 RepID=UPI002D5C52F9|nr:O-antigen ligase family protein [Archangium sp.]HYO58399.1 O-antigen ligase family protein [Archangium sp.]